MNVNYVVSSHAFNLARNGDAFLNYLTFSIYLKLCAMPLTMGVRR